MLVHLQPDVLLLGRPKALGFHPDRVVPDGQQRHEVVSAVVGFRFARNTGALCGRFYTCARKYRPRFVRNGAEKASRGLAIEKRADGKYKRTENYECCLLG